MSTTKVVLFDTQFAPATDTEMFESPTEGAGTIIDKMTATNIDSVNRSITARIVPPDGTPTGTDFLIKTATLTAGQCYLWPEVVGQMLAAGGTLRLEASAAGVIVVRASGRNETSS